MMHVVTRAEQRRVPWRNGRGWTTEVAVFPPGAEALHAEGWVARLSVASVEEDGPFSSFPGIDRTLLLYSGQGMDLVGPNGSARLVGRYAMHRFAGEAPITARLMHGPVQDVNWMVRRSLAQGDAAVRTLDGSLRLEGDIVAALVLDGRVTANGQALEPLDAAIGAGAIQGEGTVLLAWAQRIG